VRGYRGTGGYFRRELGEARGPRDEVARVAGKCADTGAPIKPGDIIQRDRSTGRVILIKSS
jgi:hypothetical protein